MFSVFLLCCRLKLTLLRVLKNSETGLSVCVPIAFLVLDLAPKLPYFLLIMIAEFQNALFKVHHDKHWRL